MKDEKGGLGVTNLRVVGRVEVGPEPAIRPGSRDKSPEPSGDAMDDRMKLQIEGMGCGHCVAAVRTALEAIPDVEVERVELGSAAVRFVGPGEPDRDRVLAAVREAGFEPMT
jgi:copper chaperone